MTPKPSMISRTFAVLATLMASGSLQANTGKSITLKPGSDVATIVADAPEGTTFYFEAGTYRTQTIIPKDNQRFIGKGTAGADATVVSGARVLTDWKKVGVLWVADGLPDALHRSGYCGGNKLCTPREDLFVDGKRIERARELRSVTRDTWFSADNKAYLSFDPAGHRIEVSLTPYAFVGTANNITIRDLVVEKFASEAQHGTIYGRDAEDWQVIDVVSRWNHGAGLSLGKRMRVSGGSYSYNGQLGIHGEGTDAIVENLEIAHNNFAGFNWGWEAGGTKFVLSDNLTIRNTCVHDNAGPGLWMDINNINIVVENNKVFNNDGVGIKHEISYKALIRNNFVSGNGKGWDNWLWGSQILVQNSRDVSVLDNTVEVPATFGNGIGLIHQKRGSGTHGPWFTYNTTVSGNLIVYLADHGLTGLGVEYQPEIFEQKSNNIFDRNTYVVPSIDQKFWQEIDGNKLTWTMLKSYDREPNGKLIVERRAASQPQCDS